MEGLHKLRPAPERLSAMIQLDEGIVGGKGGDKSMILVGVEVGGRVRMAHADNNDEAWIKSFVDGQVADDASVVTDGLASYNTRSLGERPQEMTVQTRQEKQGKDALQNCHWAISNLKRWLLSTHHGVGRIAARVLETLVAHPPMTMCQLINNTKACRLFQSAAAMT